MAMMWTDASLLLLLLGLAALLIGQSFAYLTRRDAQETRRNLQETCHPHVWVKRESMGLICRLCEKIPG